MTELDGFLEFIEYDSGKHKTKHFRVLHSDREGPDRETGDELGVVKWYSPWRRYAFFPNPDTLYDVSCLGELVEFVRNLMEARTP